MTRTPSPRRRRPVFLTLPVSALRETIRRAYSVGASAQAYNRLSLKDRRADMTRLIREAGVGYARFPRVGPLAAFLLALLPALAHAQAPPLPPTPGIDCAPLTTAQARHWLDRGLCATLPRDYTPTTTTPTDPTEPAPDCDPRPNPYAEPDRAAACTAWDATHRPKPALPTFEVDAIYRDAYDWERVIVLAVSRSLEGVPVVTVQGVKPADGRVFSFRVDQGRPWQRVPTP